MRRRVLMCNDPSVRSVRQCVRRDHGDHVESTWRPDEWLSNLRLLLPYGLMRARVLNRLRAVVDGRR